MLVVLVSDHCAHNGDCHPALYLVAAIMEHWGCAGDIIQLAVVLLTNGGDGNGQQVKKNTFEAFPATLLFYR